MTRFSWVTAVCQTLDKLPRDFKVPVVYPEGEDCIGVLLGQDRYQEELFRDAFTWFLTPGWAAMGIEFVFHELQLHGMAEKGMDPLQLAHRMLRDYKRALLIEMETQDSESLLRKGQEFAREFHMRLEKTRGLSRRAGTSFEQGTEALLSKLHGKSFVNGRQHCR